MGNHRRRFLKWKANTVAVWDGGLEFGKHAAEMDPDPFQYPGVGKFGQIKSALLQGCNRPRSEAEVGISPFSLNDAICATPDGPSRRRSVHSAISEAVMETSQCSIFDYHPTITTSQTPKPHGRVSMRESHLPFALWP